jgi:hypothetical protein
MTKKLPIGWDRTVSGTLGVRTGTPRNLLTQLASQVGAHRHALVNLDTGTTQLSQLVQYITAFFTKGGIARNYAMQISSTSPNAGSSSMQIDEHGTIVNSTDPMDITPDSIFVAYYYYIKP